MVGMDIAHFNDGRIQALYVLLDPAEAGSEISAKFEARSTGRRLMPPRSPAWPARFVRRRRLGK